MQVEDLINKSIAEMTDDELLERLKSLKSMRVVDQAHKPKKVKSNSDKQMEDMLKNLSPEKKKLLASLLKEG